MSDQPELFWRWIDGVDQVPKPVKRSPMVYLNIDIDGYQIGDTTHHATEEEAWARAEDCILMGVSLAGLAVKGAKGHREEALAQAAAAAVEWYEFKRLRTLRAEGVPLDLPAN